MRFPLRPAAMAGAAGAVVLAGAAGWASTRALASRALVDEAARHVEQVARLGVARVRASQGLPLDSVVRSLARSTRYRVSVFDGEMRLLADSRLGPGASGVATAGADPASASPSASLPEIAQALRDARAPAFSHRVGEDGGGPYLFSAARLYWQGETAVIRFGAPTQPIAESANRAARNVALAVLGVGATVLAALYWALGRLARSMGAVGHLLARIGAGGAPSRRVPLSRVSELARAGSAANRLRTEVEARAVRAARERDELAALVDQVDEGLIALDADARVLRINPAAKDLLGLTAVLRLAPVGSVVRDKELRDLLEASVKRPEARSEVAVDGRRLDVRTKGGTKGGAVVLLVDVTAIRRLEEVRSDFVANASHELKTPLTVIRGAAETVIDEELPPHLRDQFLRSIESNTVRLQRLVDDLLDLSRYESGGWRPVRQVVSPSETAWQAWGELEEGGAAGGVKFRVAGDGRAQGDAGAVHQVFRNLFENALRYVAQDGGRIWVEVRGEGELLQVSVRDNGAGIPASALPRIFERFYKIDPARSRAGGGTGLGLAIVRHLVSTMGGDVSAESVLGSGTTISFTLPLVSAADAAGVAVSETAGRAAVATSRPEIGTAEHDAVAEAAGQTEADANAALPRSVGARPVVGVAAALAWAASLTAGCAGSGSESGRSRTGAGSQSESGGSAAVVVVGVSGSMSPLAEVVAEAFAEQRPGYRVAVSPSGSGGAFGRLCRDEVEIAGSSRPISAAEAASCRRAGRDYLAVPVARDGVTVVANAANTAVTCLTLAELARIWEPSSRVATWRDLRPGLPREKVRLYGPGPDSGTLDFFTTVVAGRAKASRADYHQTASHHLVARGVAGHLWALGYFGYAHYANNRERLRAVAVDTGFGCVPPSPAAFLDGRYSPLARDLYIYVGRRSLARSEVYDLAQFFVGAGETLAVEVGYAPLPASEYARSREGLTQARAAAARGAP